MGLRIRMILMIKCCVKNKDDTPESWFSVVLPLCFWRAVDSLVPSWLLIEKKNKRKLKIKNKTLFISIEIVAFLWNMSCGVKDYYWVPCSLAQVHYFKKSSRIFMRPVVVKKPKAIYMYYLSELYNSLKCHVTIITCGWFSKPPCSEMLYKNLFF